MARLRRVDCAGPGIRRRRRGKGFEYLDDEGRRITEPSMIERIRELAIPPAWEEVWICPYPMGHIQATGTDAAGRKQYRYHDLWRERRDREKFEEMIEFATGAAAAAEACQQGPQAHGHAAGARACLRHAPARPRLLPHRLRGLRGGERHLRNRHDAEAARDRGRRPGDLRLRGQGGRSARAGRRRPRGRRDRQHAEAPPWRWGGVARVQEERPLGRRQVGRRERLRQEGRGRRLLRQGLPHLERNRARGRRARRCPAWRRPRTALASGPRRGR